MDSAGYDYCLSTLASCCLIKQDYRHCVDYACQSIDFATSRLTAFRSCHWAAQAYARLGMADSSVYYLQLAPLPLNKADSVLYFSTKVLIARDSVSLHKLSGDMADTLVCHEDIIKLVKAIKNAETDRQHYFNVKQQYKQWLWLSVVALFLLISGVATFLLKRYKEKKQSDIIAGQREEISRLGQALESEIAHSRKLQNELGQNEAHCRSLNAEIDRLSHSLAQKDTVGQNHDELTEILGRELCTLRAELCSKQDAMRDLSKQLAKHQVALKGIVDRQKLIIMAHHSEGSRKMGHDLPKLHSYMAECFTDDYCKILVNSVRALYPRLDHFATERPMDNKSLMVACMHLAGFPNKVIREFLGVDRDHTVTNIKKHLAESLLGKGGSLDWFRTPV